MKSRAMALGVLLVAGCGGSNEATGGAGGAGGKGGTSTGTGMVPDGGPPPVAVDCTHKGSGKDYQVGEGKEFATLGDVPFESLVAGDTVRVFWRESAYHEKIAINGQGTAEQPIRLCGVPGPNGELPVIDGQDATTRPTLQFPFDGLQPRGLITIGHAHDNQDYYAQPSHIVIEGLEIRNASMPFGFTDKDGQKQDWWDNAAGIFAERADDLTIRGCSIHDNENGLFLGSGGDETTLTKDVLVESNYIHHNGSVDTDGLIAHNAYNEVTRIVYQFNHFGPSRNLIGNAIKERSAGVIIRYNWIDDGPHLLDLVDSQEAMSVNVPDPAFHETYVYGNVLIRGKENVGSLVHYGGDSGIYENYRKGTLHFYANTIVIDNGTTMDWDITAMFEASTNEEALDVRNNVFYSAKAPGELSPIVLLGPRDGVASGILTLQNNWIAQGWTEFDEIPGAAPMNVGMSSGLDSSIRGVDPGFVSVMKGDYTPAAMSPLLGKGAAIDDLPPVQFQYAAQGAGKPRDDGSSPIIGAFGP